MRELPRARYLFSQQRPRFIVVAPLRLNDGPDDACVGSLVNPAGEHAVACAEALKPRQG
jgi:hypothetical protein